MTKKFNNMSTPRVILTALSSFGISYNPNNFFSSHMPSFGKVAIQTPWFYPRFGNAHILVLPKFGKTRDGNKPNSPYIPFLTVVAVSQSTQKI
uniref:Uncharacterized protein n=1 Tax=Arundo donax TaxID=35708 RepID=A0A0A9D750_ARUDO